jgi:arylsulfatase A-like enzyme
MRTVSPTRPNIVLIFADDWGYGDLSCLNPQSRIPTPHTDALARQGTVFTDAHSCSAVCTPSRYGLLTGRYAWRSRLKEGVLLGFSRELIEPGRLTMATLLQRAGYHTACIGKWHLGLGWTLRSGEPVPLAYNAPADPGVAYDRPLFAGPHTVGFDYSFILPASLDMAPYVYIENGVVMEAPGHVCESSPRPAYWRGGPIAPGFQHKTCLLECTRRAEAFLAHAAQREPERPFFLYLPLPSPHTPHVPRAPFRGRSRCGAYGDYVVEHDWAIGRVVAALDRHGLREHTMVVVTSDNGAHMRGLDFDFEREYGHRSSGRFRGQKSDAWEGGHRVPFIVSWPGHTPPGSCCDCLISQTDCLATMAELLELPLSEGGGRGQCEFSAPAGRRFQPYAASASGSQFDHKSAGVTGRAMEAH